MINLEDLTEEQRRFIEALEPAEREEFERKVIRAATANYISETDIRNLIEVAIPLPVKRQLGERHHVQVQTEDGAVTVLACKGCGMLEPDDDPEAHAVLHANAK